MAKAQGTREDDAGTLALSDPELLQLTSLIQRVSANQLRGILVSRLSLRQLVAIGSAIVASLVLVFGAGYGAASFVSEVKDSGTEYKVLAKEAELKAMEAELKSMQAARAELSEKVSNLSRERDEAASGRDDAVRDRTRMAKVLGFYHLLSTCQNASVGQPPAQDQAVEILQAHTKQLIEEKLATPYTKDQMVQGIYVKGEVLVGTGLGQWSEIVDLPIDHPARSTGVYMLPMHCWFPAR